MPNQITAIKAFRDNYIWAIHHPNKNDIVVVDPGDPNPVLAYLQNNNFKLSGIILTHHHWDHSGGIEILCKKFPALEAFGPKVEPVQGLTTLVQEGDKVHLLDDTLMFDVLDIPGHTLGHVAYVGENLLFCGDTLFSCGCGRVFEGTPQQMVTSLKKLSSLPKETRVYCGHEYTLANIAFAKKVEPDNADLQLREIEARTCLDQEKPTLPSLMGTELKTNPFLRCSEKNVIKAVQQHTNSQSTELVSIFAKLRDWKNRVS